MLLDNLQLQFSCTSVGHNTDATYMGISFSITILYWNSFHCITIQYGHRKHATLLDASLISLLCNDSEKFWKQSSVVMFIIIIIIKEGWRRGINTLSV